MAKMKHFSKFIKSYIFWTIVFGFWTFVFAGIDSCSGPKEVHKNNATKTVHQTTQQTEIRDMMQDASEIQKVIKEE